MASDVFEAEEGNRRNSIVVVKFVTKFKEKVLRIHLVQVSVFSPAEEFLCLEVVLVESRTEDRDKRPQHNREETCLIPCLFKLIS